MHRFDPANIDKLTDSARAGWFPRDPVLSVLAATPNMTILDFGSGPGYFTLPIAQQIGASGTVVAADIEPIMLQTLVHRARQMNIPNIYPILIDDGVVPLKNETLDRVLLSLVVHEIENRSPFFAEIQRALAPQGQVVIVEWHPWLTEHGPDNLQHRVSPEQLSKELRDHMLEPQRLIDLGSNCYVLVAGKRQ